MKFANAPTLVPHAKAIIVAAMTDNVLAVLRLLSDIVLESPSDEIQLGASKV